MVASLDLVDIWRLLNKDMMRYTWRRGKQASRIDYFLIPFALVPRVLNCCIGDSLRSDHSLVTLLIDNLQCSRGRGYWKFNVSLLNDDSFVDITRRFIKEFFEDNENSSNPHSGPHLSFLRRNGRICWRKIMLILLSPPDLLSCAYL